MTFSLILDDSKVVFSVHKNFSLTLKHYIYYFFKCLEYTLVTLQATDHFILLLLPSTSMARKVECAVTISLLTHVGICCVR